ncbi:integrase [Gordonia sp. GN26]
MAWTQQLPSGRYRAGYRDEHGRQRSAGTFDKEKVALGKAQAAEDAARLRKPRESLTWGEWRERWVPTRTVEASTLSRDNLRIVNHLAPKWDRVALGEIGRPGVQSWVRELSKSKAEGGAGLSPSSVRKTVGVLSASLKAAMREGLIDTNPCTALEYPAIPPSPERWLSDAEVDAIREVLADQYRFTFELLVGTGCRWGEVCGIHYDDVDLVGQTITIRWAWERRERYMKAPKTGKTRVVPIGDKLAKLVAERLDAEGLGEPLKVTYKGGKRPLYGLVLRTASGTPPNGTSFAHGLAAAGNAAFIGDGKSRKRVGAVRPHDLRHTFGSSLVQKGIPLDTVSKLMGHSSVLVTQRYASAAQSQWDAVRNALG